MAAWDGVEVAGGAETVTVETCTTNMAVEPPLPRAGTFVGLLNQNATVCDRAVPREAGSTEWARGVAGLCSLPGTFSSETNLGSSIPVRPGQLTARAPT